MKKTMRIITAAAAVLCLLAGMASVEKTDTTALSGYCRASAY